MSNIFQYIHYEKENFEWYRRENVHIKESELNAATRNKYKQLMRQAESKMKKLKSEKEKAKELFDFEDAFTNPNVLRNTLEFNMSSILAQSANMLDILNETYKTVSSSQKAKEMNNYISEIQNLIDELSSIDSAIKKYCQNTNNNTGLPFSLDKYTLLDISDKAMNQINLLIKAKNGLEKTISTGRFKNIKVSYGSNKGRANEVINNISSYIQQLLSILVENAMNSRVRTEINDLLNNTLNIQNISNIDVQVEKVPYKEQYDLGNISVQSDENNITLTYRINQAQRTAESFAHQRRLRLAKQKIENFMKVLNEQQTYVFINNYYQRTETNSLQVAINRYMAAMNFHEATNHILEDVYFLQYADKIIGIDDLYRRIFGNANSIGNFPRISVEGSHTDFQKKWYGSWVSVPIPDPKPEEKNVIAWNRARDAKRVFLKLNATLTFNQ